MGLSWAGGPEDVGYALTDVLPPMPLCDAGPGELFL